MLLAIATLFLKLQGRQFSVRLFTAQLHRHHSHLAEAFRFTMGLRSSDAACNLKLFELVPRLQQCFLPPSSLRKVYS